MNENYSVNMADGPRLYSYREGIYYYGAYHLLEFSEEDRGKKLTINVDTKDLPVCWIELWPAKYDGKDWVRWTTERGREALALSGHKPHPNPSLTWKITPGEYTVYFVNSSASNKISDLFISFQVEVK